MATLHTSDTSGSLSPGRRPRNWEVLRALASLTPPSPSPSLSTNYLAEFPSSGEIPIFLDSGILPGSPLSELRRPEFFLPSCSAGTIGTVGTFGPLRKNNIISSDSGTSIENSIGAFDYSLFGPASPSSLRPRSGYYDKRASATSRFTLSTYLTTQSPSMDNTGQAISSGGSGRNSPVGSLIGSPNNSPMTERFNSHSAHGSSENMSGGASSLSPYAGTSMQYGTPCGSFTSLSTVAFATNSVSLSSSSLSTSISQLRRNRFPSRFDAAQRAVRAESRSCSPNSLAEYFPTSPSGISEYSVITPTRAAFEPGSSQRTRTVSNSMLDSRGSPRSGVRSRGPRPLVPPRRVNLPAALTWLSDCRPELHIDQESHRRITLIFKLVGYKSTAEGHSTEPADLLTSDTVSFRPESRVNYAFHHGVLDPLPVLRRVTIEGETDKDYISRQAQLSIKANGVYVVTGAEAVQNYPSSPVVGNSPSRELRPPQPPSKLHWRFEYVVDDRIALSTGKAVPGEKTFTPLTFACSPGLLHPAQGKKIKFYSFMMKNIGPKLVAARMAVPRPLGVPYVARVPNPTAVTVTTGRSDGGTPDASEEFVQGTSMEQITRHQQAWLLTPETSFSEETQERSTALPQMMLDDAMARMEEIEDTGTGKDRATVAVCEFDQGPPAKNASPMHQRVRSLVPQVLHRAVAEETTDTGKGKGRAVGAAGMHAQETSAERMSPRHRRVKSLIPAVFLREGQDEVVPPAFQQKRRRAASIATVEQIVHDIPGQKSVHPGSQNGVAASRSLARHIVPPADLINMMTESDIEPGASNSGGVHALKPPNHDLRHHKVTRRRWSKRVSK